VFYAIIPTLFLCFLRIIPTLFLCFLLICYPYNYFVTFLMFFILVHVTFFSSRCMLELKFAICYREASLPSQAFYAVLGEESLTRTGFFGNQQYFQFSNLA